MQMKLYAALLLAALLLACKPGLQVEQADKPNQAASSHADGKKADQTLCAENEDVLISCRIEDEGKIASMCASRGVTDASGYVYYTFGTRDTAEIVFPKDKSPPNRRFKRTHLSFAGATGGIAYSFVNGDWKYIFYSVSGTGFNEQGMMIIPGDAAPGKQAKAAPLCEQGSLVENENAALRKYAESWAPDAVIDKHGLPPLSDKDSLARCLRQNTEDVCRN